MEFPWIWGRKMVRNVVISGTFFENLNFMKISVSPGREPNFQGPEHPKSSANVKNSVETNVGKTLRFKFIFCPFSPLLNTLGLHLGVFLVFKMRLSSMRGPQWSPRSLLVLHGVDSGRILEGFGRVQGAF